MFKKNHWIDPLKLAHKISLDKNYKESWVFLYSGLSKNIKNSKSYIALYPNKEVMSDNFDDFEAIAAHSKEKWFGYFGYDLKNSLEDLPKDEEFKVKLPNLWFVNFHLVLEFDHDKKSVSYSCADKFYLDKLADLSEKIDVRDNGEDFQVRNIGSNFSKEEYLQKVSDIKNRIIDGNLYQANLTRKFYGQLDCASKFNIFLKLNKVSPGNFSSFLKLGHNCIISSSPELFLNINEKGVVSSSPIKGTSPRFSDKKKDLESKIFLQNCSKEKAENLMIVDLVRNDLSRSCDVGSIKVKDLFKINSYKTLHHMVSDVFGKKRKDVSFIDVIKNCFPPASMTGTPKIKAMEVCSELEVIKRGVYSGSIGLVSKNKCSLSVVIRTLILQGDNFEFQVGGAITHGSNPEKEWHETINKAKGIAKAINIKLEKLKKI
jgi:para-aminobenzoate synthetase component 1